jgi:aspartyl aminopeptidase
VLVRAGSGFEFKRVKFDQPLVKIPSLAIHMNREVNEKGLLLEKQEGVAPLMPLFDTQATPEAFLALLADVSDLSVEAIQGWELALYDTQKAAQLGPKGEWVSSSRIDNLMSCHAILSALLAVENRQTTSIAFFFDHEEVGSLSARGAAGNMLPAVLKRLVLSSGLDEEDYQRCCSHSDLLSVDMAHAWHPAHAASYDPQHSPCLNQGPVIKINSNLRYTTDPHSAARFRRCCETVGVTPQTYIHRNNLPCGSTVGPYLAAATGIRSADIGNPMWGMHSVRETAGTYDQEAMIAALGAFLDRRDES